MGAGGALRAAPVAGPVLYRTPGVCTATRPSDPRQRVERIVHEAMLTNTVLASADAALAPVRDPQTLTVAVERIRDRLAPIGSGA